MKFKTTLFLAVSLFFVLNIQAQVIEKNFRIGNYTITQSGNYQFISFENALLTGKTGEPVLPYFDVSLMLPPGHSAEKIEFSGSELTRMDGTFQLYPKQYVQPVSKGKSGVFARNEAVYTSNEPYPAVQTGTLSTQFMNGYSIGMTTFTPVIYYPASGQVFYYKSISIKLSAKRTAEAEMALENLNTSAPVLNRLAHTVQNVDLASYYPQKDSRTGEYDMIIITSQQYQNAFQEIIDLYKYRGIQAQVVTTQSIYSSMTGTDNQDKIRNYIKQEYQNNGVTTVMLAGDVDIVPYRGFYCHVQSSSVYEDSNIPSDLYFSALDGNWNTDGDGKWGEIGEDDLLPEVSVARFSFSNQSELTKMIHKTISYQASPVLGEFQRPIMAGEHLWDNPLTYGCDYLDLLVGVRNDNGYTTTGYPENYNFQWMCDENGTWSKTQLIQKINQGSQFIHHSGHSNSTYTMRMDISDVTNNNFSQVNGVIRNYSLVYSHGCICGAFDDSDCIGERFMTIDNFAVAGALNSRYGWFNEGQTEGPSAHLHREFVDALFDWKENHIGMAHLISRTQTAAWVNAPGQWEEGALRWCFYDCNILGDPALRIWTDEPITIQASFQPTLPVGVPSFEVSVVSNGTPVQGLVCMFVKDGVIHGQAYTNASGTAVIEFSEPVINVGEAQIYISGYNCQLQEFPVMVVPNSGSYVVTNTFTLIDYHNGLMDYGEDILLTLEMKNVGTVMANNVNVTISTTDEYITITDATASYGNIAPGATAIVDYGFAFSVADNLPDHHYVTFQVVATDGTTDWNSIITIEGHAPVLEMGDFLIMDNSGNGNGKLDPGETAQIVITAENSGSSEAIQVMGTLTSQSPFITIVSSDPQPFGNITGSGSANAEFTVSAAQNTPAGNMAQFNLALNASLGITGSGSFQIVVGQIPVVIIDLDGNHNSGNVMQQTMNSMGISAQYTTSFPADLNLYTSAFVCLGIYSDNHTLTDAEGQALADFLNNGGSVYMEGGDTWYYDEQTPVHAMFGINASGDGSSDLGTIVGQTNTFTQGMTFTYTGDNNWIDHIDGVAPAVTIFKNQSPAYGNAVFNSTATYKTIGASFEFGGLGGTDATKQELMQKYLENLEVIQVGPTANFTGTPNQVCAGNTVQFSDYSIGTVVSWSWTFEGGNPGTSNLQNPVVAYANAGIYDVTLTVSDGTNSNTITKNDYIHVNGIPAQPGTISGPADVCQGETSTFNIPQIPYASSYDWTLNPSNAGTITVTGNSCNITWSNSFAGTASLKVCGMNTCGTGPWSAELPVIVMNCVGIADISMDKMIQISPNPSDGLFTVTLNGIKDPSTQLTVESLTGERLYSDMIGQTGNQIQKVLDLTHLSGGVYLISISNTSLLNHKKLVIR